MAGALAGTLLIDIAANTAKLVQGFADAEAKSKNFVDGLKKIGGLISGVFSVHAALAFAEGIQKSVDAMADMAENLKIPVQDFQALQNSALLAGQSIENTSAALGKFNVFIGKAAEGSKDQIERLNELGVKILDVNGKVRPTTDLLQEVARAITSISDPARRAAAEVDIFGKSGQSISAILPQFAKGAEALNAELSAMGLVHGPETVKAFAEMSDKADVASKKIEVFFGYFYAIGKSTVLQAVAAGLQGVTNAINALQLGSVENMIRVLTALALIGTVAGAPAGVVMLTSGLDDAATILNKQIDATSKSIEQLEKNLESYKAGGAAFAEQTMQTAGQIAQLELRRSDLIAKQKALNPLAVTVVDPKPGAAQPAIKGGTTGVDKYAEAMRKLKEETQATQEAIDDFNKRTAAGESGKAAERQAKLLTDISKARTKVITDIPAGVDPKPLQEMAEALVKLKFQLSELEREQQIADGVHKDFGDGTRELRDRMDELNKAYRDGKISVDEYNAAVKGAQETQQKQAQAAAEAKGGIDGFIGGIEAGMAAIEKSTSTFAMGQEAIMGTWNIMSDAISSFVQTGEFNFQKMAASFAKMLADMLARWAAAQIILAGLKALGFAAGAASGGGQMFGPPAPASSGMLASGGYVMPGRSYTVGERGPETFVPTSAGRVEPNGNGAGGGVVVNVEMRKAEGAKDPGAALEFGRRVKVAVQGVIEDEKRPGGALYSRGAFA